MILGKNILAVIPARRGSKRLPGKNIKLLAGKPLIEWTICEAKKSKYIDNIVVTTDCEKIAELSKKLDVNVPFIRPKSLSDDNSSSYDVVIHVLDFYKDCGIEYDIVILLQPTSPLRNAYDIDMAIELFFSKNAESVVSVSECEHSPLWSNTISEDLSIDSFLSDEIKNLRSQDLPTYYRLNGAIYVNMVERLYQEKDFIYNSRSFAYIMPKERSVDIDSRIDFELASILKKEEL